MRRLILVLVLAVAAFARAVAVAAPIACPPSQTATHTADAGWFCENPAGNPNASERPKH